MFVALRVKQKKHKNPLLKMRIQFHRVIAYRKESWYLQNSVFTVSTPMAFPHLVTERCIARGGDSCPESRAGLGWAGRVAGTVPIVVVQDRAVVTTEGAVFEGGHELPRANCWKHLLFLHMGTQAHRYVTAQVQLIAPLSGPKQGKWPTTHLINYAREQLV